MEFQDYLKKNAHKIEEELRKILSEFVDETKKISPELLPFAKAFINSCQGGKRIRGVLCKLGYELVRGKGKGERGKLDQEIFKVGAALEIMHTAILVHDDIMDKSPTRRGQPSLYKRVGVDQAIALADYGFFLAIKIISESSFPEKEKTAALKLFSQVMMDTAIGQIMDLDLEKYDRMIVARLKTAQYTIAGPLCLGAILAGAEEKTRVLREFGESLGIAFQIRDDILDGERDSESQALVLKYANQAKKLIPKISSGDKMVQLLMSMTEFMVERTK